MRSSDKSIEHKINSTQTTPTIALLPWGDTWEDWFDSVGISFDVFCNELTGGWKNNYIDALSLAGVKVVMIYASARVNEPSRFIHKPTGATICLLPVSDIYSKIRRQMVHPYPSLGYYEGFEKLFGDIKGLKRVPLKVLRYVAPYLPMPLGLLVKELRYQRCSAILCQDYEHARFDICVLLGKLLGLPVYASFQSGKYDYNKIGRFVRPFTMKACTGLAIGTQTEINRVHERYELNLDKVTQIFNPVNIEREKSIDRSEARAFFGIPQSAQVVVWHGRIDIAQKGLDILLDAWKQLCHERNEDLRLFLMGTGTDADKFQQQLSTLSVQNVFWINKYVNDRTFIQKFLSVGDVYAFPSRYEGFPVAPIEAMSCGLPIVATEVDGIPDILKDPEKSGGIVVPINDSKTFAEALGRVLDDQVLRLELGKRARYRVETSFSLDAVGQQLRDFLLPPNRGKE
jgi:glycosyltransferase involved in cell wall biosynthesis